MKQNISEELNRFNQIMGYQKELVTERHTYPVSEQEEEPAEAPAEGGEEEVPGAEVDAEGNDDFDFGDVGGEEAPVEEPTAEMPAEEPMAEPEGDVEEIDVTDIVSKSEEAKTSADEAANKAEESLSQLQGLMDKFNNLEQQLGKMDSIMSKVSKIEADIKSPEEKLELQSLNSYPFNQKLTDYWSEKAEQNPHYDVTGGSSTGENGEVEYRLTSQSAQDDYSEMDVKSSFNPEI